MKSPSPRLSGLNQRARVLLAVAVAALIIAVIGGALLAFDPPLLARLARTLPGATMPANAVFPPSWDGSFRLYRLIPADNTGLCMRSDWGAVVASTCPEDPVQLSPSSWWIENVGGAVPEFTVMPSSLDQNVFGLCLGPKSDDSPQAGLSSCNDSDDQRWWVVQDGDKYKIMNRASGLCLLARYEDNPMLIYRTEECSSATPWQFTLIPE
jgi:hypothetical protein